jgi:hypothetical protein
VAINAEQVGTPGWWLRRLYNMLGNKKRQDRLATLARYRSGDPPPPRGADAAKESYEAFVKKSRTNFAELVVAALAERITPVGFATGQDNDETGDEEVGALWERAGMDVESSSLQDMILTYGEAYMIVGELDEDTGAPVVTAEDPRWIVGDPDPANPRRLRAALKVVYDDTTNEDRAYLYMKGAVYVARRSRGPLEPNPTGDARGPIMYFNPQSWEWDNDRSGRPSHGDMPVVRFTNNKEAVGEFESHMDILDRINHQTLQCMVIATMQAFRVRAVINLPDRDPDTKAEIDYSEVFRLDPGSIWQLPADTTLWESETTDLRPILNAIKDDLTRLAAATRTPMHMLDPGGDNQSAEGANLQREGLVFKAETRIKRWKHSYAMVASLMLRVVGDTERADLSKLECRFAATERLSLAERADAAAKAVSTGLPMKTVLVRIWGYAPDEAERVLSEIADERLLQQQLAQALAAGPEPVGGAPPEDQQTGQPGQQQQGNQQGGNPPPGNQQQQTRR